MALTLHTMTKLHLGCGSKHIDGFINIDARQLEGVDEIDDITSLKRHLTNSIDLIYCSHVLEHTGRNQYMSVLKRWYDLLKVDGIIRLAVPDMEAAFNHYQKNKNLRTLRGFLWGGQNYSQNYHYIGFDFNTLSQDLADIGFHNIRRYDWRRTEHSHILDFSCCHLPHNSEAIQTGIFPADHTLMSLNIEATK